MQRDMLALRHPLVRSWLLLLLWLLSSPTAFALAAPQLELLPAPRESELRDVACSRDEGEHSWCVLSRGVEFCKCHVDAKEAFAPSALLFVVRDSQVISRWSAEAFLGALTDFRVFQATEANVPSIVINGEGMGNGLAPSRWAIATLDRLDAEPTTFHIDDFHPQQLQLRSDGVVHLLATEWRGGLDRKRGSGFYLTGQPFLLEKSGLTPDWSKPAVRRRLLNSFMAELDRRGPLGEHGEFTNRPRYWLSHGNTERCSGREAFDDGTPVEQARGFAVNIRVNRGFPQRDTSQAVAYPSVVFEVETESATAPPASRTFHYSAGFVPESVDPEQIDRIGEEDTSGIRLYPEGYFPADFASYLRRPLRVVWLTAHESGTAQPRFLLFERPLRAAPVQTRRSGSPAWHLKEATRARKK